MSDFWTRRKAAVQAEERAEQAAHAEAAVKAREAELAERPDEDLLAEAGLPDPDTVIDSAQVREFLQSSLPDRLKNRALRRLWRMDPVLANVDGLVDYGEDYTDAAMAVANVKTAYRVGSGFAKVVETGAEIIAKIEDEPDAADGAALVAEESSDTQVDAGPALTDLTDPAETTETVLQESQQVAPTGRRMAFSFDAGSS